MTEILSVKISNTRDDAHIPALDGLRGIAILGVLAVHISSGHPPAGRFLNMVYRRCDAGWIGVDLFFVLSGFLITRILINIRATRGTIFNFYIRRLLRTLPLYVGLLGTAWIAVMVSPRLSNSHQPGFAPADNFRHTQVWLWTYLANVRIAHCGAFVPFDAGLLTFSHFWSLAVEEQFYLVWPVMVIACPPRWLLRVTIAIAIISALARVVYVLGSTWGAVPLMSAYVLTPYRADGLLAGATAAILLRSKKAVKFIQVRNALLLVIVIGSLIAIHFTVGWSISNRIIASAGYSLLAVSFAIVLLCSVLAHERSFLRTVLEQRWLRLLGKYSYGIYALHLAVFAVVVGPTTRVINIVALQSIASADAAARIVAAVAAIVAAAISWHMYEKHFLRLKRFFPNYPTLVRTTDNLNFTGPRETPLNAGG